LKNCVKPPSAEAESDTPGDEKPLARGATARGVSSEGREGGVYPGVTPETKIRVNSPPPASAGGGCGGPFTTCVDTRGASLAAGGAAGRGPMLLNSDVNSPGAAPAPEPFAAPGPATGLAAGAAEGAAFPGAGANRSASGSAGVASFLGSWSNARRNIPVALRGSCSDPELELLVIVEGGPVPHAGYHPVDEDPSVGTLGLGAHCEAYTQAFPP
jgi:hypothetical protein